MTEELGPVEYMIVSFEGNRFKGEIIPALTRILDLGLIRVLDVAIVSKDKEGNTKATEETDLNDDVAVALANYYGKSTELLTQEDLIKAAEDLPINTTAAAMLFEHVWAKQFAQAIRNANGAVLMDVRIPHDVIEAAQQDMHAASTTK